MITKTTDSQEREQRLRNDDEKVIYAPFDSHVSENDARLEGLGDGNRKSQEGDNTSSSDSMGTVRSDQDATCDSDAGENPAGRDGESKRFPQGHEAVVSGSEDDGGDDELAGENGVVPASRVHELEDRINRLLADWDNYRKRVKRDEQIKERQSSERIVLALIPVIDNFDRALAHASSLEVSDGNVRSAIDGFSRIHANMIDILFREGVSVINPKRGDKFDISSHQAVQRVTASDCGVDPNAVYSTLQVGYRTEDKVLRPAMVIVSC